MFHALNKKTVATVGNTRAYRGGYIPDLLTPFFLLAPRETPKKAHHWNCLENFKFWKMMCKFEFHCHIQCPTKCLWCRPTSFDSQSSSTVYKVKNGLVKYLKEKLSQNKNHTYQIWFFCIPLQQFSILLPILCNFKFFFWALAMIRWNYDF